VTEIPEHLLRRSRERRAALGGGDGEEQTATEQAAATTTETPRAAAPVPAGTGAPATQAAGGGGGARGRAPAPEPAVEEPRYRPTRTKTPVWILPVLVLLPLWMVVYLGAFGNRTKAAANDPVVLGGEIFSGNCATCHGVNGEGGVGPQLNGGEVLRVWPKLQDQINWVHTGGAPYVGKTIGSQTVITVPSNNVMPAFGQAEGGPLSNQQIADVVCYERVTFGGAPENPQNCPATG